MVGGTPRPFTVYSCRHKLKYYFSGIGSQHGTLSEPKPLLIFSLSDIIPLLEDVCPSGKGSLAVLKVYLDWEQSGILRDGVEERVISMSYGQKNSNALK
jgi:hypothetical protein